MKNYNVVPGCTFCPTTGVIPPIPQTALPPITGERAALYTAYVGSIVPKVVLPAVAHRGLRLTDLHIEDLGDCARDAYWCGLVGFSGPDEDTIGLLGYAKLCAMRATSKRLNQYRLYAKRGHVRLEPADNNDTTKTEKANELFGEAPPAAAAEVRECLGKLTPEQQEILARAYGLDTGEPASDREIGEALGVTRKKANRLRNEALAALRELAPELAAA